MGWIEEKLSGMFELPSGGRVRALEGLRGFAVTLVFLVHYHSLFGSWISASGMSQSLASFLECVGHAGVDLFFVLSGYLIYGAAVKGGEFSYGKFMQRRLRRIYPTFLVVFAAYLALSVLLPSESKLPPDAGSAALYVLLNALLLPGILDIPPLITVAWSLSYEVFFYAAIPLVVACLRLRGNRWSMAGRMAVFLALGAAFTAVSLLGVNRVQLLMFVSGILVYECTRIEPLIPTSTCRRSFQDLSVLLLIAALPVTYAIMKLEALGGAAFTVRTLWLFAALGCVVWGTFEHESALARLFSVTPLRWLGNMSYSYYLVHGLVLKALGFVLLQSGVAPLAVSADGLWYWLAMPLAFIATLVVSACLFAWVEKPLSLQPARAPKKPRNVCVVRAGRPVLFPPIAVRRPLPGAARAQV